MTVNILKNRTGIKHENHSCSECSLGDLCLPMGMDRSDMGSLEEIVQISKPYRDGDAVFREGDQFATIFAVKSGMFKTVSLDEQGQEKVLGFHLPGELVGLDAIYPQQYSCSAIALGTSSICSMSYEQLTTLAQRLPTLQHQLLRLMSREVHVSHKQSVEQSADQKMASFLFGLSKRYEQRGYSPRQFNLAMPRRDIANHLGMAAETVSRILKRFQESGVVGIDRRELIIEDFDQLKVLAGCAGE